jgi:outer membrane protein OmpA-like peptidoglycan-associated protein
MYKALELHRKLNCGKIFFGAKLPCMWHRLRNMTFSQQRADAVKTQLVSMGVDAARLTTKRFGDTKPIGSNDTPEGKANNRRVEFVKM